MTTTRSVRPAITALAWSLTDGLLAVGAHDGVVQLWSVDGAPRLVRRLSGLALLPGQDEAVQALAFSPDGRLRAVTDKARPPRSDTR